MTTAFGKILGLTFGKSGKLSNLAIDCTLVSSLLTVAFLGVYSATGLRWVSYAGVTCLALSIVFSAAAFSAQTISQVIRFFSKIMAKNRGEESPVFQEDAPLYAKLVKKAFKTTKEKGVNLFRPHKARSSSKTRSNVRVRANRRTHRRVARPTFARPSGDGNGDSSGDSDPGEPPRSPFVLAFPTPFSFDDQKPNSFSRPQRFFRRYGCWRMRRHGRCSRRWSA